MSLFRRFLSAPFSKLKAPRPGCWDSHMGISNRNHPGYLRGWKRGRKYRNALRSEFKIPYLLTFFHYYETAELWSTNGCVYACYVWCSANFFPPSSVLLNSYLFGPLINQCSVYRVVLLSSTLSMQTMPSIKLPLVPSGGIRLYVSVQYPVSFIPYPL